MKCKNCKYFVDRQCKNELVIGMVGSLDDYNGDCVDRSVFYTVGDFGCIYNSYFSDVQQRIRTMHLTWQKKHLRGERTGAAHGSSWWKLINGFENDGWTPKGEYDDEKRPYVPYMRSWLGELLYDKESVNIIKSLQEKAYYNNKTKVLAISRQEFNMLLEQPVVLNFIFGYSDDPRIRERMLKKLLRCDILNISFNSNGMPKFQLEIDQNDICSMCA